MQYFDPQDLDEEERSMFEAIENGEFVSVANFAEEKAKAEASAKATLNKTKSISIRISERDLFKLRAKAIEEGIPYQTYASSILHKAASK